MRSSNSFNPMAMVGLVGLVGVVAYGDPTPGAVVSGNLTTTVDAPLAYTAKGDLFTSMQPANPPAAMTGPQYAVPPLAPPPAGGAHWSFSANHTAGTWGEGLLGDRAVAARLTVEGKHLRVPAPGHGEGMNVLPPLSTPPITIRDGRTADVAAWGGVPHPGPGAVHFDIYNVVSSMSYTGIGATRVLGGPVEINALHQGNANPPRSWRTGAALVAPKQGNRDAGGGSSVSFDAATGTLSFDAGSVGVLDTQGGLSGGVDPAYSGDSMLGSSIEVSDLSLQGVDPDGRYVFGGGTVSVLDPSGEFGLTASFDRYVIGDTSDSVELSSFGILINGSTFDMSEAPSIWLGDFVKDHLQRSLTRDSEFDERWIDLSFITDTNLVDLTSGFTTDALGVPADIYVGGNGVPEPASIVLLAIGALFALRRTQAGPRSVLAGKATV